MLRSLALAALLFLTACPDRKPPEVAQAAAPAATAIAPAPAAPVADAGVVLVGPIVFAAATVGTRLHVEHRTTLALAAEVPLADGGSLPAEAPTDDLASFDVEVLAAEGPAITKAKVSFRQAAQQQQGEDAGVRSISGKTWGVEWGTGAPRVTKPNGKPASDADASLVATYAELVRPSELQLMLSGDPLPARTELPELARAFGVMYSRRERLKGGPPVEVTVTSARLEDRGDVVSLEVKLEVKAADRKLAMFSYLSGTVDVVKATGLIRSMHLAGPVELTLEGAGKSGGRLVESTTIR